MLLAEEKRVTRMPVSSASPLTETDRDEHRERQAWPADVSEALLSSSQQNKLSVSHELQMNTLIEEEIRIHSNFIEKLPVK